VAVSISTASASSTSHLFTKLPIIAIFSLLLFSVVPIYGMITSWCKELWFGGESHQYGWMDASQQLLLFKKPNQTDRFLEKNS
jgi:hypothetical protein